MAISGFVGAGVQDALSQQLAEQLRQAMFEEEQRQAQAREAMAAREQARREAEDASQREHIKFLEGDVLNQRAAQSNAVREAGLAEQAAANRRSDMANVQAMPGLSPDQRNAEIVGSGVRGGEIGPIDLLKLNTPAPDPNEAIARELGVYKAKKEIDQMYRPPTGSGGPKQPEWVIGPDGQPIDLNGVAPPGTRPYEKGAGGGKANDTDARIQEYTRSKTAEALQTVNELLGGRVNAGTAGVMGMTKYLPGTPARSTEGLLDQLKGQIAFKELAAMRAASPTGGALGQVSERELALLSSVLGALDQLQDPGQLRAQLEKVRDSLSRMNQSLPVGANQVPGGVQAAPVPNSGGGGVTVTVGGKTYSFPNEAAAARFRAAAGGV